MWRTIDSKDVRLPVQLQRAMAAEAEASREARAKVIAAEGEFKASTALKEASMVIAESPAALQLRYLQVCVCLFCLFFYIFCTTVGSVAFSNDYLVQRALCADSEHHFGREEFDHHFPTAHRFPDSVYEINRLRRFIPTRNPIGRTHSADKRKQHFSRATLTRYKNMCVDV